MKVLGKELLDNLLGDAKASPRRRAHLNLHKTFDDKVQRLFIALSKGSYVEPHYHELPHQWEMFVVINGVIRVTVYNSDGSKLKELLVGDGEECRAIEFQPFDIHSVECISDDALMLEVKEGAFDPDFAKVLLTSG
ncbi:MULTISPECIES: WbuC family cupin fold metalloprotein [unclassified Shewanella]|uniref:WbuC family cupin fold metalloprotein n=1 Tax=unclassified Shewanella TaxID=196818 RepID=UPI001BBD5B1F|nr:MULTISPECIES: WbuC family cupin fold metalloprotein [unclassified Shewanella]GIU18065.1 hypothetical protein TUM4444_32620 [Shewanella sp. MBTL60-112-B1]GIU38905.1 hypothetical protein TUM4445_33910 [Shewanella sp. MBTL60-112-B2]